MSRALLFLVAGLLMSSDCLAQDACWTKLREHFDKLDRVREEHALASRAAEAERRQLAALLVGRCGAAAMRDPEAPNEAHLRTLTLLDVAAVSNFPSAMDAVFEAHGLAARRQLGTDALTSIGYAAAMEAYITFEMLLRDGAKPFAEDGNGFMSQHLVGGQTVDGLRILAKLKALGADLNADSLAGTPMDIAAINGDLGKAQCLRKLGAKSATGFDLPPEAPRDGLPARQRAVIDFIRAPKPAYPSQIESLCRV